MLEVRLASRTGCVDGIAASSPSRRVLVAAYPALSADSPGASRAADPWGAAVREIAMPRLPPTRAGAILPASADRFAPPPPPHHRRRAAGRYRRSRDGAQGRRGGRGRRQAPDRMLHDRVLVSSDSDAGERRSTGGLSL